MGGGPPARAERPAHWAVSSQNLMGGDTALQVALVRRGNPAGHTRPRNSPKGIGEPPSPRGVSWRGSLVVASSARARFCAISHAAGICVHQRIERVRRKEVARVFRAQGFHK